MNFPNAVIFSVKYVEVTRVFINILIGMCKNAKTKTNQNELCLQESSNLVNDDDHHHHHHDHHDHVGLDWLRDSVPGEPGVDYPIFGQVPETSFRCSGRQPGMLRIPFRTLCCAALWITREV